MYYAIITEASRKAKAVRQLYEQLHKNHTGDFLPPIEIEDVTALEGIVLAQADKQRALNFHLNDEHLSPYMKSNLSLFHFLMMDETATIHIYRTEIGWALVFEDIQISPQSFGLEGHDMR